MKFNYKRIIKVLTSFSVVALVLVSSLILTVSAAGWTTLHPVDYIDSIYYEGNIRNVRYDFKRTPLIVALDGGTAEGYMQIIPNSATSTQTLYVYPLGFKFTGGPPLSNNPSNVAIDITEFKPSAFLTVSSSLFLKFDINYTAFEQYLDERYRLDVLWSFSGYNSSGGYVGTVESTSYVYSSSLQDVGLNRQVKVEIPISLVISPMDFEDKVSYVVPSCKVVYTTLEDEPDLSIEYLYLGFESFTMSTHTDMLSKESETLNAIENQLGDLNDKAETIINGNQHQQSNAQDGSDQVEQNQEEMEDVLAKLDNYEKLDTTTAMEAIRNFLQEDGWKDVRQVISPVIDWSHTITIMLIVLSLINLSIILFGR